MYTLSNRNPKILIAFSSKNYSSNYSLKAEFFHKSFNSKSHGRNLSTLNSIKFSKLNEQREKTLLFFQDDFWQDEELFRSKYFLKIILSFKKNRENMMLPYFLKYKMDKKVTKKYLKLISTYLQNLLVENIDQINSKFFLFFYFLTKLPFNNNDVTFFYKKKLLLRNLFFIFFFSKGRTDYFLTLTKFNSIISKTLFSFKARRTKHIRTIFPRGLFLLLYSPYRSIYSFSSTNQVLAKRKNFSLRLKFISKYIFSKNIFKSRTVAISNHNIVRPIQLYYFSGIEHFRFKKERKISAFGFNKSKPSKNLLHKNFHVNSKPLLFCFGVPQIHKTTDTFIHNFQVKKKLPNLYIKTYIKDFLKKLISKINIFLHYLRSLTFSNKNKKKRKAFRNLTNFFISYFRFVKGVLRFLNFSFFNFRYVLPRIEFFLLVSNSLVKNLNIVEYSKIDKLNFLNSNFSFQAVKPLIQRNRKIFLNNPKLGKFNLTSSIKLKKGNNNFRYFWLFLTTGHSIDLFKAFSIFFNSYVSFLSKNLDSFSPFKKFSSILWFHFFSNKVNYTNIVLILKNYNQFLYLVNSVVNKKEFVYLMKNFPLIFHYPVLKEVSQNSINLTQNLVSIFDFIIMNYKTIFNRTFVKKFEYFFSTVQVNTQLTLLKKIRQNSVQQKIIERQNLANIEILKIKTKRLLLKKPVIFPKTSAVRVKRKNKLKKSLLSQKSYQGFLRFGILQRSKIEMKKKMFWKKLPNQLSFYFIRDSYLNRNGGKRQKRHKKEYKRKVKRFFSNVMFFVKFVKEKKILKSYYKFNRRSFRLSIFHKLSTPFFLRLKLKRLLPSNNNSNNNRLMHRISFLAGSSVSLTIALSSRAFFSFFFVNFDTKFSQRFLDFKIHTPYSLIFKSQFSNSVDLFLIKNWLFALKNNYYMFMLKSFSVFFPKGIRDYLELLKFFMKSGFFFYLQILFNTIFETFLFFNFLSSLKSLSLSMLKKFVVLESLSIYSPLKKSVPSNSVFLLLKRNFSSEKQILSNKNCCRAFLKSATRQSVFSKLYLQTSSLNFWRKNDGPANTLFHLKTFLVSMLFSKSPFLLASSKPRVFRFSAFLLNYVSILLFKFFYYKNFLNLFFDLNHPHLAFDFFPPILNFSFFNLRSNPFFPHKIFFTKLNVFVPSIGFFSFFYNTIIKKKTMRRQLSYNLKKFGKKTIHSHYFFHKKFSKKNKRTFLNDSLNKRYKFGDFFFRTFSNKIFYNGSIPYLVEKQRLRYLRVKFLKKKIRGNLNERSSSQKNKLNKFSEKGMQHNYFGSKNRSFFRFLNKLNYLQNSFNSNGNSYAHNTRQFIYKSRMVKSFNFSSKFYFLPIKDKSNFKSKKIIRQRQKRQQLHLNSFTFFKNCFRPTILSGGTLFDSKIKDLSRFMHFKNFKSFMFNLKKIKFVNGTSQGDSARTVKIGDFFNSYKSSLSKFYYIGVIFKLRRYLNILVYLVNQNRVLSSVTNVVFLNLNDVFFNSDFYLTFLIFVDLVNFNFLSLKSFFILKLKSFLRPLIGLWLLFFKDHNSVNVLLATFKINLNFIEKQVFCFSYLKNQMISYFLDIFFVLFLKNNLIRFNFEFFFVKNMYFFSIFKINNNNHEFSKSFFKGKKLSLDNSFFFEFFSFCLFTKKYSQLFNLHSSIFAYSILLLNYPKSFITKMCNFGFLKFVKYKKSNLLFVRCLPSFFLLINDLLFVFLQKFLALGGENFAVKNGNTIYTRFLIFLNSLFFDNLFKIPSSGHFYFLILRFFYKNFLLIKNFSDVGVLFLKLKTVHVVLQHYQEVRALLLGDSFYSNNLLVNFIKIGDRRLRNPIKNVAVLNLESKSDFISKDKLFPNSNKYNFGSRVNTIFLKNFYYRRSIFYRNSLKYLKLHRNPLYSSKLKKKTVSKFAQFYKIAYAKNSRYGRQFLNLVNFRQMKGLKIFSGNFKKVSNILESSIKVSVSRLKSRRRSKMSKYHTFLRIRFHSSLFHKIFLSLFISPRFLNFKALKQKAFFLDSKLDHRLKRKTLFFFRLNRFLEFLISVSYKVRSCILKRTRHSFFLDKFQKLDTLISDKYFYFIFNLYKSIKLKIKRIFKKLSSFRARKNKGITNLAIKNRTSLNFSLQRFRFSFFYNFFGLSFLRFFVLRYFFSEDFVRFRLQFVNRFFWFRSTQLNSFLCMPKIFIIISKAKNNFFITGIDLFGRILYKCSPGMVHFTGSDRISKYAWFDTSVDFSDGFLEFFKYFLRTRKRERSSTFRVLRSRSLILKEKTLKRKFGAAFDPRFTRRYKRRMLRRRNKSRIRLRRFFIISKGVSDFNVRIFLKGISSNRFFVKKFVGGYVNYPMKSFSLCRIRKVRRK